MRTNSIAFLMYSAVMASSIFIPNMARDFGASNLEIGIIVTAYGLSMFLASYIFGRASDIYGRLPYIVWGLLLCSIFFFAQVLMSDVESMIIIRALAGFGAGIAPAALIAYVYESRRSLGRLSAYGSLGWAAGSIITIAVAVLFGSDVFHIIVFAASGTCLVAAFLISLRLKEPSRKKINVPVFPLGLIRKNLVLYVSVFARHLGATSVWLILPLYLADMGASYAVIGAIYAINSGMQFLIMPRIEHVKNERLINAGLLLSAFVCLGYTLASTPLQVVPVQILLALSWSCLYVGSLISLMKHNLEKATSVGMLNSVISISGIFGPLLGGAVSQLWGFHAVMYAAAGLSVIGFLLFRFRNENY